MQETEDNSKDTLRGVTSKLIEGYTGVITNIMILMEPKNCNRLHWS